MGFLCDVKNKSYTKWLMTLFCNMNEGLAIVSTIFNDENASQSVEELLRHKL